MATVVSITKAILRSEEELEADLAATAVSCCFTASQKRSNPAP